PAATRIAPSSTWRTTATGPTRTASSATRSCAALQRRANDVGLERLDQLLERCDLRADRVARLGVAHRARAIVDLDVGHRRHDVGAVLDHRLAALEVMVLR